MNPIPFFVNLTDAEVCSALTHAIAEERKATVHVLELLAAMEHRQLFLAEGYPSLYVYCIDFLHLSESDAFHRVQAARAGTKWPQLFDALREGALTMSSLLILAPHMTNDNCDELLAQARYQPKRVVERIVAGLAPRPDAPSRITPLAPGRYRFQVTIDEETHELILMAQRLMQSSTPDVDLSRVTARAFRELVDRLLKQKAAVTDRPKAKRISAEGTRRIPAQVRREVWTRDGGRCAFEGPRGRCPVSGAVDFHHVIPFAMGGEATVDNLELRCRAHNLYQARQDGLGVKKGGAA